MRRSRLKARETAIVLGGGPIGLLVAMVAKEVGANVTVSEVNEIRIAIAKEFSLDAVNPIKIDMDDYTREKTDGRLVDVVFEVVCVQPALGFITEATEIRGRILMVAIHGKNGKLICSSFSGKS